MSSSLAAVHAVPLRKPNDSLMSEVIQSMKVAVLNALVYTVAFDAILIKRIVVTATRDDRDADASKRCTVAHYE